jgi:hypothetical protein
MDRSTLVEEFIKSLNSNKKCFNFIQQSLRYAKDIYKKGGHVIMVYTDREFKLAYDNRREIITGDGENDPCNAMLKSVPWKKCEDCLEVRGLLKIVNTNDYNRILSKQGGKSYKNYVEVGVRSFIKGFLNGLYGLKKSDFSNYQDLIDFVKGYEPANNINLSKQGISNLRNRRTIIKNVPRIKEVLDFALYVKTKIPHFDLDSFFK